VPPAWLTAIAWLALALGVGCALAIAADILLAGRRQHMRIMEAVWPITALYAGPLALWAYLRHGRPDSPEHGERVSVALGVSHCGAGCTLGDIAGAWIVFLAGLHIAGLALYAEYAVNFTLAFALGIAFQYAAIVPMRGLRPGEGIREALKADTLSLVAFEIGVFGSMAIIQLVLFTDPHLTPDHAAYWFLMQLAMLVGFVTAYPANVWLVRRGIKEAM
jgi:hypothetical protein